MSNLPEPVPNAGLPFDIEKAFKSQKEYELARKFLIAEGRRLEREEMRCATCKHLRGQLEEPSYLCLNEDSPVVGIGFPEEFGCVKHEAIQKVVSFTIVFDHWQGHYISSDPGWVSPPPVFLGHKTCVADTLDGALALLPAGAPWIVEIAQIVSENGIGVPVIFVPNGTWSYWSLECRQWLDHVRERLKALDAHEENLK